MWVKCINNADYDGGYKRLTVGKIYRNLGRVKNFEGKWCYKVENDNDDENEYYEHRFVEATFREYSKQL